MISEQDSTNRCNRIEMTDNPKYSNPAIRVDGDGEVRCPCNRLLMKGRPAKGSAIEIKCPKCKGKYKYKFI